MKKSFKIFLSILSLYFIFLLSGCSSQDWWTFFDVFGPFLAIWLIFIVITIYYTIKTFIEHISPTKRLQSFSQMLQFVSNDYLKRKELGISLLREPFLLPDDCFLDSDGLPKHAQADDWGKTFTVYSTKSRRGYLHTSATCSAYACRAEHLYNSLPHLPSKSWFCPRCGVPPMFNWLQIAFSYRSAYNLEMGRRDFLSGLYRECNLPSQKFLTIFSFRLRERRRSLNAEFLTLSKDMQGEILHAQIVRTFNRFFLDFETGKPAREVYVFTKKVSLLYSDKPPGTPGRKEYTLEGLVEYVRHKGDPPPKGCYLLRVDFPSGGHLHFEGCKNGLRLGSKAKIEDVHGKVHHITLLEKK